MLSFDGLNEKSLFSVIARIKRPLLGYEKCPILHKPLHPFHKNGLPRKGALMSPAEGRVGRLGKSERSPYSTSKACLAAMRAKVAVRPALMPVKLLG